MYRPFRAEIDVLARFCRCIDAVERRDAARARDLTEEHVDRRTLWSIDLHLERLRNSPPPAGRTRLRTAQEAAR